jgi:hypothetical protein
MSRGFLLRDPRDVFSHEPYVASFRAGAFDFTLVALHATANEPTSVRRAEALLLDDAYRIFQNADASEQDVILLGDFGLPLGDPAFRELDALLDPVFRGDTQTTAFDAGLTDNIWWDPRHVTEWTGQAGIERFDAGVSGRGDAVPARVVPERRLIWVTFHTDTDDDGVRAGRPPGSRAPEGDADPASSPGTTGRNH